MAIYSLIVFIFAKTKQKLLASILSPVSKFNILLREGQEAFYCHVAGDLIRSYKECG